MRLARTAADAVDVRLVGRAFRAALAVVAVTGVLLGNVSVVVNAAAGLGVAVAPVLLERRYGVAIRSVEVAWISATAFLHAVGILGPYHTIWWWDHLTHLLSATIVAGVGYTVTAAADRSVDDLALTRSFTFVFVLAFTLAFGVIWEVFEFAARGVARLVGQQPVLVQFGLEDTMTDLVFDLAGAVIVAGFATSVLAPDVRSLAARIERES